MAIKKITFTNANVTAQNDADLYYFLQGGTGILKGIKNEVKASNNANRFIFESGYISIYGRLLFVDNNTDITVPLNRTAKGYVVLDINTATNIAELTYTESTNGGYPILIQENLSSGVGHYQFAIAAYSKTSAALTPDQSFKPAYLYPHIEKQQGSSNANKVFMTDASGNFILVDTIPVSAIPATGVSVDTAKSLEKTDGTKIGADEVALKKDFNNVDNTSDKDKPISNATQQALDLKADKSDVSEVDIDVEGTSEIVSIPENATGYGTIEKLGGKSYKSENLLVLEDKTETTINGITYSIKNGVITLNGTASTRVVIYLTMQQIVLNGNYTIAINSTTSEFAMQINDDWYSSKSKYNINVSDAFGSSNIWVDIPQGTICDNIKLIPMLVRGSTAPTEFSQGFEGIKIEYPTNVKVAGKNLWDEEWELGKLVNGVKTDSVNQIRSVNPIYVDDNTQYFINKLNYSNMACYSANNQYLGNATYQLVQNKGYIVTTLENTAYVMFDMGVSYGTTYNSDIAIIKGTSGTYSPYTEKNSSQTNAIDYVSNYLQTKYNWSSEFASKWLGLGVGNDSNIIDYANPNGIVKYSILDLETLNYSYNSEYNFFYSDELENYKYSMDINALCSKYDFVSAVNSALAFNDASDKTFTFYINNDNPVKRLYIKDSNYTDAATFKQAMQGVYLIYELAEPIEIDLSSLDIEAHFECESNGTIIHDNLANYKYSFPVSLKGQVALNFEHDKEQQRDIDELKKEIDLKANKSDVYTKSTTDELLNGKANDSDLTPVATSGSYNDLRDKPTIPTVNYPVTSVNGKTGAVKLSAGDVGARPSDWTPSKTDIGLEKVDNTSDSEKEVASAKVLKNNDVSSFTLSAGVIEGINFNDNSVYLIYNNTWCFIMRIGEKNKYFYVQSTVCYNEGSSRPLWFIYDNNNGFKLSLKTTKTVNSNEFVTFYDTNETFNYKLLSSD